MEPYIWQRPSVDKTVIALQTGPVVINASDTGTGKTVVACASIKRLSVNFIVVAPIVVHSAWARTIELMGISDRCLGIVNPQRLLYKNKWYNSKKKVWGVPKNAHIIWDEVHHGASGPTSQTTTALALTKAYNIPVMAMSATIADSPLKLRALGYLLGLHDFKLPSFKEWIYNNGCYYDKRFMQDRFMSGPSGQSYMRAIHATIESRLVRISIAELDDFPDSKLVANLYDLTDKYTKEINKIYEEMDEAIKSVPKSELAARTRARQQVELMKVPLLRDLALEELEAGKSPVLFVTYRDTASRLKREIESKGHETGLIIGAQTKAEKAAREEYKRRFQTNKIHCMVCTMAGGVGIDLHDELKQRPRSSFITPSDNAVHMVQCIGRIRRSGGTDVIQTFVMIAGTIEERIHANLTNKLKNISSLNDGDLI
tara:strand:+ start:5135 stop:6418 length:1284 start_codon:yes stop_codon:yes gene_type:complete